MDFHYKSNFHYKIDGVILDELAFFTLAVARESLAKKIFIKSRFKRGYGYVRIFTFSSFQLTRRESERLNELTQTYFGCSLNY